MPTTAGHMVASLGFLDEYFTIGTSFPFLELILEILITWTLMECHHAFLAVLGVAFLTFWWNFCHIDEATLALLFLAQF